MTMSRNARSAFARSRLPLYDQLATELRRRIRDGQWAEGERLPILDALASHFGVGRVTVRQALALLEQEGLIWRRQGKGTFVARQPRDERWLRVGTEWSSLLQIIEGTQLKLLESGPVDRPPMYTPEDGEVAQGYQHIRRVHVRDDRAYCDIDLYLAQDVYQQAPETFRTRLVLETLSQLENMELGSAHQTLTIGRANMETANLLDMDVGGPVAQVRRVITDRTDRVIYLAQIVYRGDFVRLDIQLLGNKKTQSEG